MNWCVFFLFILNVSYRFGRIAHILTVILYVVDGKYCFEADVIKWTQWGCFKVSKCGCTFNIMQQHHTSAIHAIVHILHSPSTYLSMECIWSQERATAPHKYFAYIIEFMYSLFHVPWTNSQERWYFLVNIYATNCTRTKLQKKANVQFVMCTLCISTSLDEPTVPFWMYGLHLWNEFRFVATVKRIKFHVQLALITVKIELYAFFAFFSSFVWMFCMVSFYHCWMYMCEVVACEGRNVHLYQEAEGEILVFI